MSTIRQRLRHSYFEHLVPDRTCGDCTACCQILTIDQPDLQKPAGVLCPHHTGTGCSIYAKRPQACRDWHCLWRRVEALGEQANPANCGVVFSVESANDPQNLFEHLFIICRAINGPADFDNPDAVAAINWFIEEASLPVWLAFSGTRKLVLPPTDLAHRVEDLSLCETPTEREEAQHWRDHFAAALGRD